MRVWLRTKITVTKATSSSKITRNTESTMEETVSKIFMTLHKWRMSTVKRFMKWMMK
jgi:hypothetical protein